MNGELLLLFISCVTQAERPAPQEVDPTPGESVELRLARAEVELAEANLKRVRQMNLRYARTVPASVVAEFQQDVDLAKLALQLASAAGTNEQFQIWLDRAKIEWQTADRYWKNSVVVNRNSPSTVGALDVERLRLRAQVAKLQFERGQELATADGQSRTQWQIELVNTQLQRVREDARLRVQGTNWYPVWW